MGTEVETRDVGRVLRGTARGLVESVVKVVEGGRVTWVETRTGVTEPRTTFGEG